MMNYANIERSKAFWAAACVFGIVLWVASFAVWVVLTQDPHRFDGLYAQNLVSQFAKEIYKRTGKPSFIAVASGTGAELLTSYGLSPKIESYISSGPGLSYDLLHDTDMYGFTFADGGRTLFWTFITPANGSQTSETGSIIVETVGTMPESPHRIGYLQKISLPEIGKHFWESKKDVQQDLLQRFNNMALLTTAGLLKLTLADMRSAKSSNAWAQRLFDDWTILAAGCIFCCVILWVKRRNFLRSVESEYFIQIPLSMRKFVSCKNLRQLVEQELAIRSANEPRKQTNSST